MGKGIGGFVSDLFGSTNKERATGYNVNPNAYNYGGKPGAANATANGYTAQGAAAQTRQATQADKVYANYGAADAAAVQGQQARQGQNTLAGIMANRATGGAPSIAQQQADRQMQQAQAQQASLAGSARGAGGLAAAQRNAAFNMANASSDISGQAQINAAGERRDDTNAAAGMYSNLRGGDLASQGQQANQAQFQAQNSAQQNQFNAGLRDSQAARNDAYQQNYDQMANQVRTTQLAAKMNQQGQQSANALGAQGINAGVGGQNANMNQSNAMGVMGLAQSAAGIGVGAATGGVPGKAVGGPTSGGRPYLVGEQGPELIVPQKDGYVLTADQTREALRGSPAETVLGLMHNHPKQATGTTLASIMGARALGGPVEGLPNERGPVNGPTLGMGPEPPPAPAPVPGYGGPNDFRGFDPRALDDLDRRLSMQTGQINQTADRVNDTVKGIDDRDKDAIWNADYKDRHGQQLTKDEEDTSSEARYRQDLDKKKDRADAKTKRKTLAQVLGDNGKAQQYAASAVDTAYHGGQGYVPPQLIQISGAKAMGGPVSAGGLQPMTPMMGGPGVGVGGGIEFGGGGISHNDLLRAGSGLASPQAVPGMVGGGGITGGSSMGGVAIPGVAGAREDGGPVEGSGAASSAAGHRAAQERDAPFTRRDNGEADAQRLSTLASILGVVAPGLAPGVGALATGTGASAMTLTAEDAAARKAREEQAAIEAERAAMNRDERNASMPTGASTAAIQRKPTLDERYNQLIAEGSKRTLWDIMRGK